MFANHMKRFNRLVVRFFDLRVGEFYGWKGRQGTDCF